MLLYTSYILYTDNTIRRIAWSKWGSIASISEDGYTVEFRNLRNSLSNNQWSLNEPEATTYLTHTLDGGPLKHLSWSPHGSELAVIDAAGRVTILHLFASLNKPALLRLGQLDPPEDLHGVVGCFWLNPSPVPPKMPVSISSTLG